MRVLITGGCGFIGAHTVEHFLRSTEHELVVLDALTYAGDVGRLTDIEGMDWDRVELLWHDLRAPISPALDARIGHIDAVLNIASESHVDRSITRPRPFVENNVGLALTMLEWARERELSHFVQVSTDEVYGPAPAGHEHLEWAPVVPSNPYSASKAAQEALAIAYWRSYGVPVLITNTMNNFGERQHPEKFVPLAIRCLSNGLPVPIHARWAEDLGSDGRWEASSRVWLHARNHADALRFLLERPVSQFGPDVPRPDRLNVAGERELDCQAMAGMIAHCLDLEPMVNFVDYHSERPGHDHRYALDGSKLREAGWTPPLSVEESLEQTIRWSVDHAEWLA